MSATAYPSKLAELRAKTDRDLVSIIDNALEVSLLNAAAGTHLDYAWPLRGRADRIYANINMLVSKVEDVNERRRLDGKLTRLRGRSWNVGGWRRS